jgi:hypothetical protein
MQEELQAQNVQLPPDAITYLGLMGGGNVQIMSAVGVPQIFNAGQARRSRGVVSLP